MSAPKCLFFQYFERPDRSFEPGYPREWPPDVRGTSGPKTYSLGWFFVLDTLYLLKLDWILINNKLIPRKLGAVTVTASISWVHTNGCIVNGGVACVCAKWHVFVHFCAFCAFLRVFSCQNGLQKRANVRIIVQECVKAPLCNTPCSYTPFCVSPNFKISPPEKQS